MFYRTKLKFKSSVKIKLDLTKFLFYFLLPGMWRNSFKESIKSNFQNLRRIFDLVITTLSEQKHWCCRVVLIELIVLHVRLETIGDYCERVQNLLKMLVIWTAKLLETNSIAEIFPVFNQCLKGTSLTASVEFKS